VWENNFDYRLATAKGQASSKRELLYMDGFTEAFVRLFKLDLSLLTTAAGVSVLIDLRYNRY
jgi:hypothetical protein